MKLHSFLLILVLNISTHANAVSNSQKTISSKKTTCQFDSSRLQILLENADNLNQEQINEWMNEKKTLLQENALLICQKACGTNLLSFNFDGQSQAVLRSRPICEWRGNCIYGVKLEAIANLSCE